MVPFNRTPLLAIVRNFQTGDPIRAISLPHELYGQAIRPDLMQRVAVWYRAGLRAGNACTKERGEVAGSGRKLRPQKGTGKARVGNASAPHRRGGGVVFGPKPRDFSFHLPNKILDIGFRSALSTKYLQNQCMFIDSESLELSSFKTMHLATIFANHYPLFEYGKKFLIIDTQPPPTLFQSSAKSLRNPDLIFLTVNDSVNAYHILDNSLLIMTTRASEYYLEQYNKRLQKDQAFINQ